MPGSILGNRVVRTEDPTCLTTEGVYVDDRDGVPELAGAVHVAFARSTVAHGTITSIDIDATQAMPGALGVFTASGPGLEPAVAHLGVRHIDMPASGERVWQAVRAAAG